MAWSTDGNQLKEEFFTDMCVDKVMYLNRLSKSATFTNTLSAKQYEFSLPFPLGCLQIRVVLAKPLVVCILVGLTS